MDGIVNLSYGGIDNNEKFLDFFNNIYNNVDSMIRMIQYTTEGDPVYTDIIFHCENLKHPYFEYKEKNNSVEIFDYIYNRWKRYILK